MTGSSTASLTRFLDGAEFDVRDRLRAVLADDGFVAPVGADTETHRRRVLDQLGRLAADGLGQLALPKSAGGDDNPAAALAAVEMLGHGDLSLAVAFGVQSGCSPAGYWGWAASATTSGSCRRPAGSSWRAATP